jgi:hypothetical protein
MGNIKSKLSPTAETKLNAIAEEAKAKLQAAVEAKKAELRAKLQAEVAAKLQTIPEINNNIVSKQCLLDQLNSTSAVNVNLLDVVKDATSCSATTTEGFGSLDPSQNSMFVNVIILALIILIIYYVFWYRKQE